MPHAYSNDKCSKDSELIPKIVLGAYLLFFGLIFYLAWRPFVWYEEVETYSPALILIERTVDRQLDLGKRHMLGQIVGHSLTFSHRGEKIHWRTGKEWSLNHMPQILAFVDGEPVLIFSVAQIGPCSSVGFPKDGIVAFTYRDKVWSRIDTAKLPAHLTINLLRDTFDFQRRQQHDPANYFDDEFIMVTILRKSLLESPFYTPPLGTSIAKLSEQYAGYRDSCASLMPDGS